jgi:hypothetical protein
MISVLNFLASSMLTEVFPTAVGPAMMITVLLCDNQNSLISVMLVSDG